MSSTPTKSRFEGALLGLALGDAFCAPFEGGPIERLVWSLIGKASDGKRRWTDDTQMSLDLANCILATGYVDQDDLARRFAANYRWSRGYGPGAAKILKRIRSGTPWHEANTSVYPEGSFGNGAAMRAPVIGLAYCTRAGELDDAVKMSAEITHAHPLAIDGARIVSRATSLVVSGSDPKDVWSVLGSLDVNAEFKKRLSIASAWANEESQVTCHQVRAELGNGIAATNSAVTAVYIGLVHLSRSFDELLNFARSCRGDTDTIAAMAGALWGAANGSASLPADKLSALEAEPEIRNTAGLLHDLVSDLVPYRAAMKQLLSTREFVVSPQDERGKLIAFGVGHTGTKHAVFTVPAASTARPRSVSFTQSEPDVSQTHRIESWSPMGRRSSFTVLAEGFHATAVQPLGNDILLVSSRCYRTHDSDIEKNGKLYRDDGSLKAEIVLGDGIQQVCVDRAGAIWASYFDEGIFGNCGWDEPLGASGLVSWSATGEQRYEFDPPAGFPHMADCYAMTVDAEGSTWCCYYTDFPIVRIRGDQVTGWVNEDATDARAMAVDFPFVILLGSYDNPSVLTLLELMESGESRTASQFELCDPEGQPLDVTHVDSRGTDLFCLSRGVLYRVDVAACRTEAG